jgi:hypothetical protein
MSLMKKCSETPTLIVGMIARVDAGMPAQTTTISINQIG